MSSLNDKLKISALAVVPCTIVILLSLIPIYTVLKKSILGNPWLDALLWFSSIVLFYFLSVAFMYIPLELESDSDSDSNP